MTANLKKYGTAAGRVPDVRRCCNHGVIVVLEQIEAHGWAAAHEKERLGVSGGSATRLSGV